MTGPPDADPAPVAGDPAPVAGDPAPVAGSPDIHDGSADIHDGSAGTGPDHDPRGLDLARALARATQSRATPSRATPSRGAGAGRGRRGTADAAVTGLWRPGRTGGWSGAGADERDPQGIDTALGRLVEDRGWALDLRVHGVIGRWAELVGPEVAGHCTPEAFADGRLTVRTDSTAWATQLTLLAPTVVRRLNEELGHGTVLVIDVHGPHLPTWSKGRRRVRGGRGPRDTYG